MNQTGALASVLPVPRKIGHGRGDAGVTPVCACASPALPIRFRPLTRQAAPERQDLWGGIFPLGRDISTDAFLSFPIPTTKTIPGLGSISSEFSISTTAT